jgi:NADH pyrophosphatase NudC (nudix superfamily)
MNTPFELFRYEIGPGWMPVVTKAVAALEAHGAKIVQVKEKFGGLRIYFDYQDVDNADPGLLNKIVYAAEEECLKICEQCGEPGTRRSGGWIRTLCDKHEEEYQQRKR